MYMENISLQHIQLCLRYIYDSINCVLDLYDSDVYDSDLYDSDLYDSDIYDSMNCARKYCGRFYDFQFNYYLI